MTKKNLIGYVTKSGENKYKVLASTNAIDRQGDSIDQSGWDLTNFKKNPVMPWAHDYDALPVAKAIGIEITENGLEVDFEFAPAEGNPMAQQVKVLYDNGYLNAVSVGFIPKTRNGNVITSAELLEVSFVPVPANQEALRLAVEKGLDISLVEKSMKGAVADELSAEENMEAKYANLDAMFEIVYAMCHVYCAPEASVDDFSKLLSETVTLLQQLADGEMTDEEKAKTVQYKEVAHRAVEAITEKAGRTISKETMNKIDKAIEHIKTGSAVLEDLKTSVTQDDGEKAVEVIEVKKEVESKPEPVVDLNVIELNLDDVSLLRNALRASDKQNELALGMLKNFLEKRKNVA